MIRSWCWFPLTIFHLMQWMPEHLPIIAMENNLTGMLGIKMGAAQIGFGEVIIDVNELTILRITPGVQVIDYVAIGTGSIHCP